MRWVVLVSGIRPLISRLVLVTTLEVTGEITRMLSMCGALGPVVL